MSDKRLKLSMGQVAEMVGLTVRSIREHLSDPHNPLPIHERGTGRGHKNLFLASEVYRYYLERELAKKAPVFTDDPSDVIDLARERARRERAQADRVNFDLRVALGEFVPSSEAQRWLSVALQETASLLDAVKPKIKAQLPHLSAADMVVIETEIARARNAAADKAGSGFDPAQSA